MNKIKLVTYLFLIMNSVVFGQNTFKHKVTSGETLYAIARNNSISVETIYELNPKLKGKTLQVNTILLLPKKDSTEALTTTTTVSSHTVLKGESLYSIAKKYDINLIDLEKLNPKVTPKNLREGMILVIKKPESRDVVASEETVVEEKNLKEITSPIVTDTSGEIAKDTTFTVLHVIQSKETKYGIAKKYGISIHELETLNPAIPADFPVGYPLIIKKDKQALVVTNSTPQDSTSLTYDEEEKVEKMAREFNSKADLLVDKASQYIGIKYKYGGTTPNGFDCSGLMCTTFKEIDLSLPRTSSAQANYGEKIKMNESQKGDLIFFATGRKNRISHVGMITEVNEDEIKFIHASTSSGVMISSSKEPYYAERIIQVNRVLNE